MAEKKRDPFVRRFNRIAKKLETRREIQAERRETEPGFRRLRPMTRKNTPDLDRVRRKLVPMIAYDLETTRISVGTPRLLYATAYSDSFSFSGELLGVTHFAEILATRWLTPETAGHRFVAWNGNRFDVYFIAMALLRRPEFILRPYMTKSKSLRGLRVILRQFDDKGSEITHVKGTKKIEWEFLDGMAMTGAQKSLSEFLKTFAPNYLKLDAPDWENETFNPRDAKHRAYAERDSEGLWHAMQAAQEIVLQHFNIPLSPTIGNMGIKIFQRHIPPFVECWTPPVRALRVIRDVAMRGGYCFSVRRYQGPVWKYDINQAYASAMREAWLPAGRCQHIDRESEYAVCSIVRLSAFKPSNRIPFYYREIESGRSVFAMQEIRDTWLTSIEVNQLRAEGWKIEVSESWFWSSQFRMKEYVDKLEWLRTGEGRNPKDAQGDMMKYIGNNSYGKTVEKLDGIEMVLAAEQPEGYAAYQMTEDENDLNAFLWFKFGEPQERPYHQPQIGAFITAHVRMVLRRAAMLDPDSWLYGDTDCVMFSRDMTARMDVDPGRYGAWKIEESGAEYIIAAKKCYTSIDGKTKHAKGLNVKKLNVEDFEKWIAGESPRQRQEQRQNFMRVMSGFDMFIERTKVGENFKNTERRKVANE